jgi:non-ribosomal peptide synthetase component F
VHLDRSLATYQVFLGALKAGLVVVPFHPGHPGEHRARMHRVAEPVLTVVDPDTAVGAIPESACLPVTDLLDTAASVPAEPMAAELTVDSPAFVLRGTCPARRSRSAGRCPLCAMTNAG